MTDLRADAATGVDVPCETTERSPAAARARQLLEPFVNWLDDFGDESHDPHDVWASSLGTRAKTLYYRHRVPGSLAVAPFVLVDAVAPRSLALLRPPTRFPIADAHYALGFFRLGGPSLARAESFLDALERTRSAGFSDPAWGYPFDWPSRHGLFPAGTPFITTLPYCYEAFAAGHAATGDDRYLATMEGIARFAADEIESLEVAPGASASAYSPRDRRRVVNASAYRGYLLTSAGQQFGRDDWVVAASRNLAFVLLAQRDDGSWPYSTDGEEFVDNFHTCLVLKNLVKAWALTGDETLREAVRHGYDFYLAQLVDGSGLPIPFARPPRLTLHRRDLYDYAEGIMLTHLLRGEIAASADVLERLVEDLSDRWLLKDGHFVTRELAFGRRNTVPYHRWAQSQIFHALANLACAGS